MFLIRATGLPTMGPQTSPLFLGRLTWPNFVKIGRHLNVTKVHMSTKFQVSRHFRFRNIDAGTLDPKLDHNLLPVFSGTRTKNPHKSLHTVEFSHAPDELFLELPSPSVCPPQIGSAGRSSKFCALPSSGWTKSNKKIWSQPY